MAIPPINNPTVAATNTTVVSRTEKAITEQVVAETKKNVDDFVKTEPKEDPGIYVKQKKLDAEQIKTIKDHQMASFQNMLTEMLGKQNRKSMQSDPMMFAQSFSQNLDKLAMINAGKTEDVPETSSEFENGKWGIDAVATKIMDMAVSLSGGDTSKIATLKDAVDRGFASVLGDLKGNTPSITQKTHDEINNRFEYWEKNGSLEGYKMGAKDEEKK
ncbi:MAG: hypothetical protein RR920_09895 [Lachnospiraceae bacterium]